ncbi:flavin-containing monooxygenase 5-like [Cheilinus undulatus]|uniref:flavin-containing monooxygenase 5-like n=1 Tax=Cheilinus undulatus TaxID=241271 RepID=UPI001BD2CDD4|nr:flavin-containing monooxygenase 5-like [Cheilinus undulatus]
MTGFTTDITFDIMSDITTKITSYITSDITTDITTDITSNIPSDIRTEITTDIMLLSQSTKDMMGPCQPSTLGDVHPLSLLSLSHSLSTPYYFLLSTYLFHYQSPSIFRTCFVPCRSTWAKPQASPTYLDIAYNLSMPKSCLCLLYCLSWRLRATGGGVGVLGGGVPLPGVLCFPGQGSPFMSVRTTVRSVTQRADFSESGRWDVVTVTRNGDEERHVFDTVLVCSGHYTHPALPLTDFPGNEKFSGSCMHSWEFKDADACRGRKVVVVGIGNSGGDIAVEISRSAHKTFLSTRQGAWVIGRMSSNGLPLDMTAITRVNNVLMKLLPKTLTNWAAERSLNQKYDHRLYGLQPKHGLLSRRPLINDDLPGRILQGALVMKPNIQRFTESGVEFADGSVEENIHAVVFCTGYKGTFPFLPAALTEGPHGDIALYKRVFPPSLTPPTLAVMGLFQTKGPIMPVVEMQARWAVKVFTGLSRLPPEEKMLEVIESERKRNMKSYPCPRLAALQVDYISYLDFMADQVGVRPNLLTLLLTDPVLWMRVFFGPVSPYQYRLVGPGRWAGARQAILTQWERVHQPFRTRAVPEPDSRPSMLSSLWMLMFGGSVVTAVLLALQGPDQILDRCKTLMRDSWLTG